MTLVVDASMAIAWLDAEQQPQIVSDVLRRVSREGASVPSLWKLEVANFLRTAVRRKRCDEKFAERSIQDLEQLRILIDLETDLHAWGRTHDLALTYDLTAYDAAYLELALRRGDGLATCDQDLAKAARRAGVDVVLG